MRKLIFFGSILIIILLLFFFIKKNKKQISQTEQNYLTFESNDFIILNQNAPLFEENILILFFNTHCDICELEAEQLQKNKPALIDVIFASPEPRDSILHFANKFRLNEKDGFYFAQIDTALLTEKYKPRGIPSYILYQNDQLVESGKGMITADLLKQKFHLMEE